MRQLLLVAAHNAVRQQTAQEASACLGGTVSIPDLTWDPVVTDILINQNPLKLCHRCVGNACNPPLNPIQCDGNYALASNINSLAR